MNNILEWILVGGGSAVLGSGISWLVFLPYKRRSESLKNEVTSIQIWKELCTDLRNDNACKDKKIDELYDEIKSHREEKSILYKEKETLVIENARLETKKCNIKGCTKRDPPSWW